jgi:hypothetical protein
MDSERKRKRHSGQDNSGNNTPNNIVGSPTSKQRRNSEGAQVLTGSGSLESHNLTNSANNIAPPNRSSQNTLITSCSQNDALPFSNSVLVPTSPNMSYNDIESIDSNNGGNYSIFYNELNCSALPLSDPNSPQNIGNYFLLFFT